MKMSKTKKLSTLGVCLAFLYSTSTYQAQEINDSLSMDVTFVGEREMVVKDAIKLQSWPEPRKLDGGNRDFSYKLLSKRLNVTPEWTYIEPIQLRVDAPLARLYRGYIRAGFGMYNTPLLELSLTDLRSREGTWGVQANHFATDMPNTSINNRFRDTRARLWTSRFIGKEKVNFSTHFNNNAIAYYGNPINSEIVSSDNENATENYMSFGSSVEFKSHHRDSTNVNHQVSLDWIQLRSASGLVDNNFGGSFEVGKFIGTEKFSFITYYNFDKISIDSDSDSPNIINEGVVGMEPTITTYKGNLTIKAGAGLWVDADNESRDPDNLASQNFYIFPKIDASISLMKDLFIPYLRLDGSLQQNRLQTVLNDNRFYEYMPTFSEDGLKSPLRTTARKNDISLGMRGTITDALSFNFYGRTVKYDDYMFFMNSSSSGGVKFETFFEDIRINSASGNVNLKIGENFELAIDAELYKFQSDSTNIFWNLPSYRSSIDLSYTLIEKFTISSTTNLVGARTGLSAIAPDSVNTSVTYLEHEDNYAVDLPAYIDMNLSLEYRYNRRTAIWLCINNITNSDYRNWTGYRVQGIQALFGASYSF